ncbi:T9SS type A sorting domain-containing protein [Fulvivirga maritima]|uniref:T9SS type A sorting domain-containing protein n=1 Tax=Fulvivirga maritima TaxID=2904247 RepID=UPI001F3941FA|nr:T9SS type A sorting domain-containing protein [Fulvivirga maritima]UII27642.1 T9SS type A sorting domain-containing protein [Fulvivirga maritima]
MILHEANNDIFKIYQIASSGISLIHNIHIGTSHKYILTELQGHMKPSPNGKKLAVNLRSANQTRLGLFQVFDFDDVSGQISNPQDLGNYAFQYGVSFSPNSELLYLHGYSDEGVGAGDFLYQFNLTDTSPESTRVGLLRNNPAVRDYFGLANISLQIGPDGRIYGSGNLSSNASVNHNSLLVINNPNSLGRSCNLTVKSLAWNENRVGLDLPNYIQATFQTLSPSDNPNIPCGTEASVQVNPNPTRGNIEITMNDACQAPYQIIIYNNLGQKVYQYFIEEQKGRIKTSDLATGAYYLVLTKKNNIRITKRLVVL